MHPPWCRFEAQSCGSSSAMALLTSSIPTNLSGHTNNPVVSSTLKIWYQFRRHFKFTSASTLAPLLGNHLFRPALSDPTFSVWHEKGLRTLRELYKDNTFRRFTDISSKFELPTSHLFRYFQIRYCTKSLFPSFPSLPPNQIWDEFLCSDPLQK